MTDHFKRDGQKDPIKIVACIQNKDDIKKIKTPDDECCSRSVHK